LAETNTLDDAIIVKGTKEKKRILDAYKEHFGQKILTTQQFPRKKVRLSWTQP
jgi:hypothetical protein